MTRTVPAMERDIPVDGASLRLARQRAGLEQAELAERVRAAGGTATQGFVSKLERGVRRGLSVRNYAKFVQVLQVEHDDLRSDRTQPPAAKVPA